MCKSLYLLPFFLLLSFLPVIVCSYSSSVLHDWLSSLDVSRDLNASNWRYLFRSRSPQTYFDKYLQKLSLFFKDHKTILNFAMVGACDGLADPTIRERYLPNSHWRGVFVEPMSVNVNDLRRYLYEHDAESRSLVLRAAATYNCETPIISVERPLYEEKNNKKDETERKKIPHWLRREIGSIMPKHRTHARPDWVIENVRCVTANDILQDWAVAFKRNIHYINTTLASPFLTNVKMTQVYTMKKIRKRRPHVLKIDVEGHDYEVLMSFVNQDTPRNELPLLIEFEGKSIGKDYPKAKQTMEEIGYIVSDFAADGFAILSKL